MAKSDPQSIVGRWLQGVALDVHTLHSVRSGTSEAGRPTFDTRRSELGELLYRLKYAADLRAGPEIIDCAVRFLARHRSKLDLLIPVPRSKVRPHQPLLVLARGIGSALDLPMVDCVRTRRSTPQLKDVVDQEERKGLLAGLYEVDSGLTAGRNILLFDDLYRSGATLNAITDLLLQAGRAASVRVLVITRTRSNQ